MREDSCNGGGCEEILGMLPLFGMELLSGDERARVVEHLPHCSSCATRARTYADIGDTLLLLAPSVEPPLGFDVRVLDAIASEPSRRMEPHPGAVPRRHRRSGSHARGVGLSALLVASALLVGIGIGRTVDAPVTPKTVTHAQLTGAVGTYAKELGSITFANGTPPWMVVSASHLGYSGSVTCELSLRDGATVRLGHFWISGGSGSWSTTLPVGVGSVVRVRILSDHGAILASASV
ncbi:MAG: zf-HC2 domain-containing protein [Acidimicrobiales bacterium]